MLDLKSIKSRGGEMPVEVDGHELVFRFRRPTQREWLEVLPAMTAIDSTMRTWALNAARATASGESIPRLSIGWEDVEPVRVFVADHIRGVDGLSYGDESVAWPDLAEDDKVQVLDLLDFEHLIKLAAAIHESARLKGDAKKK